MSYSCVLLSGGKGTRFGKSTPKQYLMFAGKPMIVHSLESMEKIDAIKEIVVVCADEYISLIQGYVQNYRLKKNIVFAPAGASRQESVYNGLKKTSYENVIIHEAARPLVTKKDFQTLVDCEYENVSYTYSIPYTVLKKNEDGFISSVLNRNELVNIQLPQKFRKELLLNAHAQACAENKTFTEDASLLYAYTGEKIFCLTGKTYNVKMTEHVDLLYGEMLIQEGIVRD